MKKRLIVLVVVGIFAITAIPAHAFEIVKTEVKIIAFSSVELLLECVTQVAMGDTSILEAAGASGDGIVVQKGTTIMLLQANQSTGMFSFKVKGVPGVWFSNIALCVK
jgi:hypothetical protein